MAKLRLDKLLVARGLVPTRARAQAAIARGAVIVDGAVATRASAVVAPDAEIAVDEGALAYVSRGATKLAHALDHFDVDVKGKIALDVGASTGGFTEVLLERGAARVYAVDVGHGQLHEHIARDPRTVAMEGLNARELSPAHIPEPPEVIVCDVSFISLKLALPAPLALAAPGAVLIALIKPQFEVGRTRLGKGGIVRDPTLHAEACADIARFLAGDAGWTVIGITPSPIEGGDGNREFLVAARKGGE